MGRELFDLKNRFIIKDYMKKSTFSGFLPGISGEMGIPLWCFYVNRGQAVTSFGVCDKDHSIMEFYPAHQSYLLTNTLGFRTFLKVEGTYYEAFHNYDVEHAMYIGSNELEIEEKNEESGIDTNILYYTLPEAMVGGLVRSVTLTNRDSKEKKVEFLDGMAAVIPYGVNQEQMKTMGQTVKAWMQSEDVINGVPYFRARFSIKDTAVVKPVEGGNFYFAMDEGGKRIPSIVDPRIIFEYDSSMNTAYGFKNYSVSELITMEQSFTNQVPCCFVGKEITLKPGESISFYCLIGQCESKEDLQQFLHNQKLDRHYFASKLKVAKDLTKELGDVIHSKTADPIFDAYCRQSYIDNVLRGGLPILLGRSKVFYIYSRKHGDIERDYNYFCMQPEYYSQGNGNYRDINQNRRCDPMFTPFVKDENIKLFYSLIQLDGFNPLIIQRKTYRLSKKKNQELSTLLLNTDLERITELLNHAYTPGELLRYIEKEKILLRVSVWEFLNQVIELSESIDNVTFGEGYWTDHWVYNLDLIEGYLRIYPEEKQRLLFEDLAYYYYEPKVVVNGRRKRYKLTFQGVRQHQFLDEDAKQNVLHNMVRTQYGKGEVYYSTLMTKLIILAVNKFATIDPYGLGIEMEGGRPGWYDALNGLPAIFGSSMTESYELLRMLQFMIHALGETSQAIDIPTEVGEFIEKISNGLKGFGKSHDDSFQLWNALNEAKEVYREQTMFGIKGSQDLWEPKELRKELSAWAGYLKRACIKAKEYSGNLCPTYFYYELDRYELVGDCVIPLHFSIKNMPLFLEGAVKSLRLQSNVADKKALYHHIKQSELYDKKLHMYKVNASLQEMSFEIGRAKAFTPGWLENESIWLHMEYKYLLELLQGGLYEEFIQDFKETCVAFLEPEVYGRSILENSSFIASSNNPDATLHGKGFVARLSGSTVEMIHIWQVMMFGLNPFTVSEKILSLSFQPLLPKYLMNEDKVVTATFLGRVQVEYHMSKERELIPGNYNVIEYQLAYGDQTITVGDISGVRAEDVRSGLVHKIIVSIENEEGLFANCE